MKKTAIAAILIFSVAIGLNAQNARKDASGNYISVNKTKDSTATGKYYFDKDGSQFPVFATGKGKLFYIKATKNGKLYRSYLKLEAE